MKKMIKHINHYKKELSRFVKELETSPEGCLIKSGTSYRHRIKGKDIGITKNELLIIQLCRKKFLIERIKQLKYNIAVILADNLENFDFRTPQELIQSFPSAYQGLPKEYFYHPSVIPWLQQERVKNTYPMDSSDWSYSNNGTPLRSKSETFIANLLEQYDLPYHYDVATKIGTKPMYPDFLIINPYTGIVTPWEHFGALHKDGYEKKMNEKMAIYLEAGFIPLETIIYTFEADAKNPARLKYLIEKLLL
ncbi:MAG: hypothetical protein FWE07_02070 [Turicibacter sp.]|nr:hypothetical protein [Turicibacter sp.]